MGAADSTTEVFAALDRLIGASGGFVAVWGQADTGGGWSRLDLGGSGGRAGVREFVWSGPLAQRQAEPGAAPDPGRM